MIEYDAVVLPVLYVAATVVGFIISNFSYAKRMADIEVNVEDMDYRLDFLERLMESKLEEEIGEISEYKED
jgi:hypothetical protein